MELIIGDHIVIVDDEDFGFLSSWKWHIHISGGNKYVRGYPTGNRKAGLTYMHRILTGATRGKDVDHANGCGLDNRKANLRICTRTQNNANRHFVQTNTSKYKGVHFESITQKWRAEVTFNGVRFRLGRFNTQEEAAEAYRTKSEELFGKFQYSAKK